MSKRRVVKAQNKLPFKVKECHKEKGIPGDMNNCVVGLALKDHFGETIQAVEIGPKISKIFVPGQVTKYKTPHNLAIHLPDFDQTGIFNAPVGDYELLPYPKPTGRKGGGRDNKPGTRGKFSGRRLRTRSSTFEKNKTQKKD